MRSHIWPTRKVVPVFALVMSMYAWRRRGVGTVTEGVSRGLGEGLGVDETVQRHGYAGRRGERGLGRYGGDGLLDLGDLVIGLLRLGLRGLRRGRGLRGGRLLFLDHGFQ